MGDPACFLSRTCLSCGRSLDRVVDDALTCPHCGRRTDGTHGEVGPVPTVIRSNTILYCNRWAETVAFYRRQLRLAESFANDWFVEFQLAAGSTLSIADATRSTIEPVDGQGITISLQVADRLEDLRARLEASEVPAGEITQRFGAGVFDIWDPEGHRIEFWSRDQ